MHAVVIGSAKAQWMYALVGVTGGRTHLIMHGQLSGDRSTQTLHPTSPHTLRSLTDTVDRSLIQAFTHSHTRSIANRTATIPTHVLQQDTHSYSKSHSSC